MRDQAGRRIVWALVGSALLHVWLAQSVETPGASRGPGAALLRATLNPATISAPGDPATRDVHADPVPLVEQKPVGSARSGSAELTAAALVTPDHPVAPLAPANTAEHAATLATASDPTYYPARSLDVYPRALTPLHLGLHTGAVKVRATVLIDESGAVNDVRAIEAGAAEIASAARDLLLRARFSPAARDGRIVRAEVVVSLDETPR